MVPRYGAIASHLPTVLRLPQGVCQLIFISIQLSLSTLSDRAGLMKSFCYSLDAFPIHDLSSL
jgi:hypothetical protein